MIDKEQAQHMTDVAGECNRLNEISQPLGYAVTASTSVDDQSTQQFTVHRLDQTVASGPKFATIEEVGAHLEAIAKLPLWRLDLVNNSAIIFDPAELVITDPTTGESFSFRGWGLGVARLAAGGQRPCAQEGVTNLSVRSKDPPTIGNWYKSDLGVNGFEDRHVGAIAPGSTLIGPSSPRRWWAKRCASGSGGSR